MNLNEIIKVLDLQIVNPGGNTDVDISRGYASDLLSDVMANAQEGDIWVTMQIHQNIIAVAVLKTVACIILVNDREPEKNTIEKAKEEKIPVLKTKMSAFELIGKLYSLGIKGE